MMERNRLLTGIYNLCKWITHFAYMNILWVLFTLLGGVVFGIIPSTVAMFAIARKTAMGEEDIPVFKTYWGTYRSEFLRSNLLGLILTVMGLVWYFDLHFFRQFEGSIYTLMNFAMMMLGMVFFILLIYVFPVYVHYDLKLYHYLTYALKIGFLRPASVVFMFVGTLCTYYFLIYLPGLIPLFGITFFAYFNMWIAYKSFQNIEEVSFKKKDLLV
ncbi:YesL family protein [Neobacillus niacini]|uniref:YesL family protein n=1 Tax=Neobacillus niacini TaxID=86668 RepID=UPI001C8DB72B|nr:YesL family protein [Neobacillus niacini]MBY0144350.1 YesL family protein [Neobacillus niacini]